MIYREAAPIGIAGAFVKCFWMLEDHAASFDIQRILPDGRCELILNFGESFESRSDGEWKPQPRWFVTGQNYRTHAPAPAGPHKNPWHPFSPTRRFAILWPRRSMN
jgi:hypothetical protein